MIKRELINEIFDGLFHQIHVKDFYESTLNFIDSCHVQFCQHGLLSDKQICILARIRNNPPHNLNMQIEEDYETNTMYL